MLNSLIVYGISTGLLLQLVLDFKISEFNKIFQIVIYLHLYYFRITLFQRTIEDKT